ncbi:MAG: hypothetical protein RIF41_23740, partial [Polyangiaceae bacterium]
MASTEEPRPLPRGWLAVASLTHAVVFAWAAIVLPFRSWTAFSVLTGALAGLHVATGSVAAAPRGWPRRTRWLTRIWRAQAAASIAWLGYVGWGVLSSAWYLRGLYVGLGQGVAAALLAVFGLLVLVTLPIALWGLGATGGLRLGRLGVGALLLVTAAGGWRLAAIADDGAGRSLLDEDQRVAARHAVDGAFEVGALPRSPHRPGSLFTSAAAHCAAPPAEVPYTLLVTHLVAPAEGKKRSRPRMRCVQASSADALATEVTTALGEGALRGPVKLELIHHVGELPPDDEPITTLGLRPGLDGICGATACLTPWQLVALSSFVEHAPLPGIGEARIGLSVARARQRLSYPTGPLTRIATHSWLVSPTSGSVAFGRDQWPEAEVTAKSVKAASFAAQQYIVLAQHRDGRFNYIVDPFTGALQMGNFSVARQAGTTLALCELGVDNGATRRVVKRSLDMLAALEHRVAGADDEATAMALLATNPEAPAQVERVGPSALALAAILRCRPFVGDVHDDLAARLGRAMLALQRPDGSFHHHLDLERGVPVERMAGLYVDGQLVLAMVLLEALALEGEAILPAERLREPLDRAMHFFATDYWDIFLKDFLYIEENWHCLAAAAAIAHHRHDAYERFCLDYVAMKSRTQLDDASDVHPDFVGGYGLGNFVPPHNTGTAGLGEAMAAALKIATARGEPAPELRERLRAAMRFLLRVQWRPERCFACTKRRRIFGGFSEHM